MVNKTLLKKIVYPLNQAAFTILEQKLSNSEHIKKIYTALAAKHILYLQSILPFIMNNN